MAAPHRAASKLVLHFDVNRTLIMLDPAGGKSMEYMLNAIVADGAWGEVTVDGEWAPTPHVCMELPAELTGRPVTTYHDWVQERWQGSANRPVRVRLLSTFTERGSAGEQYRPLYERLLATLALPPDACAALEAEGHLPHVLRHRRAFIVPAFFRLLLSLRAAGRDFTVVFRTFGSDLPEVAQDMSAFCEGRHPLFPGVRMDGSDGGRDYRMPLPQAAGCILRGHHKGGRDASRFDVRLVMVTAEGVVSQLSPDAARSCGAVIRDALQSWRARGIHCSGLRDDFHWWSAHKRQAVAGKPLFVTWPMECEGGEYEHHIFFDDNIMHDDAGIVDVRHAETLKPVPFRDALGRFLVRVDPMQVLLDQDYYVRVVEACEQRLWEGEAARH